MVQNSGHSDSNKHQENVNETTSSPMTIHFHIDHGGANFNISSNDKHPIDIHTEDVDAMAMQSVP